ncbi:MAG TPA: disulfide bond formation protein B, partial [Saliniramus sp.]|nr:disulfide bond formation protein B [Saliniramus sp.]
MRKKDTHQPRLLEAHRFVAAVILVVAGATILAALFSEYVLGMQPCLLCLYQRWPYYAAVPLAALIVAFGTSTGFARTGLALLGLIFAASALLAAYHAGVEWGFVLGPTGCGGAAAPTAASMEDFMRQLETVRVVSCNEPAFVFLGLSMAGWNAVVSVLLAVLAFASAAIPARPVSLT